MFTPNLSFIKSFVNEAQVHYKVYPCFSINEITNICALHNFGQSVRKERYDLITHKSKMTKRDKPSSYSVEDDYKLPDHTYHVWLRQDLRKLLRKRR